MFGLPRASCWIIFISIVSAPLHAAQRTVRLANETDTTVYCAFYYRQFDTLTRATEPVILPGNNAVILPLPATKITATRTVALSEAVDMPPTTRKNNHPFLTMPAHVGLWQSNDLTLSQSADGMYRLCDTSEWHADRTREHEHQSFIQSYEHADTVAHVTTEHHKLESEFIAQRLAVVKAAQQTALGLSVSRPLRIGIAASGGGFRAMLAALGLLSGLEELGLLSTVLTFAGLSGSTWAALAWLLSQDTANDYSSAVATRLGRGLIHTLASQYDDLRRIKKQKKMCGLSVSAVDLYGIGLSHTLLKPITPNHTELRFPDTSTLLDTQQHPLIVCTAVTRYTPEQPYEWVTFSPFSVCQLKYGCSIPAWSLGRTFHDGQSTNNTPPPLLGFAMGIFGSSFSVSLRDALDRAPTSIQNVLNMIFPQNWHTKTSWANAKITAAYLPNFTYGMTDYDNHEQESLCLVDGGYLNNLPLYPLVKQHKEPFDLVIIMDSKREHDQRVATMHDAYEQCEKNGYRLAPLCDADMCNNTVTISHGTAEQTSVIYVTLESDPDFDPLFTPTVDKQYRTPNLFYPEKASERLLSFMRHVVVSRGDIIRTAMQACADKK